MMWGLRLSNRSGRSSPIGNKMEVLTNQPVVSPSYSYPKVLGLHPPSPPELEGQYPNAPNDVVGVFKNEIGRIVGVESETSNLIPVSL